MKTLLSITAAVAILASPVASFAETPNAPLTRAEVRAQLVQLEKAGYNVSGDNTTYPADIQAAEAKIENSQPAQVAVATPAAVTTASTASKHRVAHFFKAASTKLSSLEHANASGCVGPADFCTPYFGG